MLASSKVFALSLYQQIGTIMTNAKKPFVNFRDAILEMQEVGEAISVFGYAYRLAISLKLNTINHEDYDGLAKELEYYCYKNNIQTSNEICSLF